VGHADVIDAVSNELAAEADHDPIETAIGHHDVAPPSEDEGGQSLLDGEGGSSLQFSFGVGLHQESSRTTEPVGGEGGDWDAHP
jgi:hypothetical protein